MIITFHSDVRFTCIIYRIPQNWTRKLSANTNGHNFSHECMIDAHDIPRHSKLNNRSSREIQMAITFLSDFRFTCIIYRDPQNWPRKFSANWNGHHFWLEWMINDHYISRRYKLNNGRYLMWAEWSYNTSYNSATGMTPFEVTFGRKPPSIPQYLMGSSKLEAIDDLLSQREEVFELLCRKLLKAQDMMKV